MEEHNNGLLEWQGWVEDNHNLFRELRPGSRVGFFAREELEQPQGHVVVLEVGRKVLHVYRLPFTGLRQLAADVLFVADYEILTQVREARASREGSRLLRQLLSSGQIVLYFLAKPKDLKRKGFTELFSNLGIESVGECNAL